jgi:hypothetical protein
LTPESWCSQDKERNRRCVVNQSGASCEILSVALKSAIFDALVKEASSVKGRTITPEDLDLYWTITDESGINSHAGEHEVITEGSAAWYLLK